MLIMFSAVVSMLFRLLSVLFRALAGVWKYFVSLPRSCNTKLTLSAIKTSSVGVMLILGANAVTLVWNGFYVA